jgi:hypothetical protein
MRADAWYDQVTVGLHVVDAARVSP